MQPRINGRYPDYGDVRIFLNAREIATAQSIEYSEAKDSQPVYGAGRNLLGYTLGQHQLNDISLTLLAEEANEFLNVLGNYYMESIFSIKVEYRNQDDAPLQELEFNGCSIKEISESPTQGGEALSHTFTIQYTQLKRNGNTAFRERGATLGQQQQATNAQNAQEA